MGKDKRKGSKRSNAFEYYTGSGKIGDMMKRHDVKGVSFGGRPGEGDKPRLREDVDRDIADAMMNDYDYRRSMEAGAMAGNKDAKKFAKKGFKPGNIYSAADTMRSLKDEYGGGGGMNGARNRASLTYDLVKADREAQTAQYDNKYASTDDLNALRKKFEDAATNKQGEDDAAPIEPSDMLERAKERLKAAAGGDQTNFDLYEKNNANADRTDDQADAARNFLNDYKKDVIEGAQLEEDIETSIANASKAVTNIYGR